MTSELNTIHLTTQDGYTLGGRVYQAKQTLKGKLVLSGATAVPQGFYKRFAQYASHQGYETLTFDYRGIGASKPPSLKGFRMNLLDWAKQDLCAAVEYMADQTTPLYIVGHSFAGHAFGLLPNHEKVSGFYVFGMGAGWSGYMPMLEKTKVLLMWNVVLPVLTWWKGYCPWKMLGMGEDLPIDVYRQWRHWCKFPHYFFDDPKMQGIEKSYQNIQTPMIAANSLDDLWALPPSRDAFLKAYSQAPIIRRDLDSSITGSQIGHMDYFRKSAEPLWEEALSWFEQLQQKDLAS